MENSQSLGTVHTHTHTHTLTIYKKRKEEAYLTSSFYLGAKEEVESN